MSQIVKKEVCECKNCGNEAEKMKADSDTSKKPAHEKRVLGTATCTHCGNEADMWIDL
jgi:hypothetical protein